MHTFNIQKRIVYLNGCNEVRLTWPCRVYSIILTNKASVKAQSPLTSLKPVTNISLSHIYSVYSTRLTICLFTKYLAMDNARKPQILRTSSMGKTIHSCMAQSVPGVEHFYTSRLFFCYEIKIVTT